MAKVNIVLLLEELKDFTYKEGQIFETLRAIYPKGNPEQNVIKYKNRYFTKPLALDKKSKKNILKEEDVLQDFLGENNRGDFIKVIEVIDKKALCENLSLKDNIKKEYYKENFILEPEYLRDGSLKLCKRSVSKHLNKELK